MLRRSLIGVHPIMTSFISQVTPSELSVIRRVAMEPVFLHHLQSTLAIRGVRRVSMHEPLTSLYAVIAIQFDRGVLETEVWRALYGASTLHRFAGKWIIAVDEDIDPENADALLWAMSYRCQPQHDLKILEHKDPGHGPRGPHDNGESAAVLVNALLKGTYAPVALPKREFMDNAKTIWERLGLPPISSRNHRGMDTISATGRRNWSVKRGWRCRAIILRLARNLQNNGAATLP